MRKVTSRFGALGILFWGVLSATWSAAATIPEIRYTTTGGEDGRKLIFSNNPEEIHAQESFCDLADAGEPCGRSLLSVSALSGAYRVWWEHSNKTKRALGFGIRVRVDGAQCAVLTISGSGFVEDAPRDGGREFVELFAGLRSRTVPVCPGDDVWAFRTANSDTIVHNKYFAGVVDFSVSVVPVSLEVLVYDREPAATTFYAGYDTRVLGGVHESLVYKGVSPYTEAVATNVDFTLTDEDRPGRLPVRYHPFLLPPQSKPPIDEGHCIAGRSPACFGDLGVFSPEWLVQDHWISHISPEPTDRNEKRRRAVVTDIVPLVTPGYGEGCRRVEPPVDLECLILSPYFKWDYPDMSDRWLYPNWGNWAVHYRLRGAISNRGSRIRKLHLGLRADGNSPIAYRGQDRIWRQFALKKASSDNPSDYFPYSYITVPPGAVVDYAGDFILSGPGAGTFEQLVILVD